MRLIRKVGVYARPLTGSLLVLALYTDCLALRTYSFETKSRSEVEKLVPPPNKLTSLPKLKNDKDASADSRVANHDAKQISENYGRLPLRFEANTGQTDSRVKFLSRGSRYGLFLTPREAVLVLRSNKNDSTDQRNSTSPKRAATVSETLRMKLLNAHRNPHVVGTDELPGKTNYLIGNDPGKWRTNIPSYARVRYENVYRAIDMVYYGNQNQLEYDFIIAPGGNPDSIRLGFEGAKELRIVENGDLVIATSGGELIQRRPIIYQELDGLRQEIAGQYVLTGKRQVGFRVGAYDKNKSLVIDPVLTYSTFLGGNGDESGRDIAVDASGNAYVTGETYSSNFPTANPLQPSHSGSTTQPDVFVTKLNSSGSALVYSTYVGGGSMDEGNGIVVDSAGSVYVTGRTTSTNFPTLNPLQSSFAGAIDAIVFKLSPSGSSFVYSTYLGGTSQEIGWEIAVDLSGNAYLAGSTTSTNFPIANAVQSTGGGTCGSGSCEDGFVSKLNASGSALVYSTYLGGNNWERSYDVAVDSSGNAYVTGFTSSTNFPTSNPLQTTLQGTRDAFVSAFNSTGSFIYSTYLGGGGEDEGNGIAVDSTSSVYVTGFTKSSNFPTVNPFQAGLGNTYDAFVTKINPTGTFLVYSTYLGGSSNSAPDTVESGRAIKVDEDGNAYIVGTAQNSDFPTQNPVQVAGAFADPEVFVTKLNAAGSGLVYSTMLIGIDSDGGNGLDIDDDGNVYVTGFTVSTNFPTTNALQPTHAGGTSFSPKDAFVFKISNIDGFDIVGQITDSGGNPIPSVSVKITGTMNQSTWTNASGNYSFPNLALAGNYTITPFKPNYTFVPTSQTFNNLSGDQTANFTGSLAQVTINGRVKDANGAGVSGVTMSLTGTQTGSVQTDTGGNYTFSNLNAGGTYTITPSRNSDAFTPTSKTYTNLSSNQTFDFTLVYRITGQVTDSVGTPASGITVSLTGGQTSSTLTDLSGNYSFVNLPASANYTVTPSNPGYTLTYAFTPSSQTFNNLSANQIANFSFTTSTQVTIFPIADAYVQDGSAASTNFGTATPLLLKSSNQSGQKRDVYFKFDLTAVSRNITVAKLRITAALSDSGSISTSAYSVVDTNWIESDPNGINWNNKPARSATALPGSTATVLTTTYASYDLDITGYIAGEKAAGRDIVSVALHNPSNSNNHITLHSRDATANKPQLVITTSDNNNAAPTVNLTAPANGATYAAPANVTINANASDADGSISRLDFYAGTSLIGTDNTAPYSVQWDSVAAGAYSLRAVAIDNSGSTTTSSAVNISVTLANNPPQVTLTAPASGLSFPAGSNINLAAEASDVDGTITKVDFFAGAVLIGTDTTNPYSVSWNNISPGAHTLTAVATDNSGGTAPSNAVNINVVWQTGLSPVADAYVRDGSSASTNFGTAIELQVQSAAAGSNRESYLKFDLTTVSGITNAKLRLYGALIDASGSNVPAAVHPVATTTWVESGSGSITWNNKPAAGAALATVTVTNNVARWYEWDITSYIQAEKAAGRNTVSFAVKNTATSTPYTTFNSREATTNQPQLQITTTAIRNILLVTGSSTLNSSETAIKTRLENLGFTVTAKVAGSNQNSAIKTTDADGKAAVVISSTVTPANVGNKFRNVVVPVFNWESDILDDLGMTGTASGTDFGTTTNQTQVAIIEAAHPMAAGLTGTATVVSAASSFTWGKPNTNAAKIASLTSDATKITIFGYETGVAMAVLPAPARRVGFFLTDTNGANLTANGQALFDAAIKWATATNVAPTISSLTPTFGTIGTSVTLSGFNFGDTQGTSTVSFNGVNATPASWSSTSITAPVPAGATSGPVIVVVSGLASNSITFTVELPPADIDGDGLADAWELLYFGNLNQGANDDPDGDGQNNLQEYQQGRNPTIGAEEDTNGGVNLRIFTPLIPTSP